FWRFSRKAVTSAEFSTGPPGGPDEANAIPPKPPRPGKGGAPGGALGPGIAEVAGEREPRELRKTTMGGLSGDVRPATLGGRSRGRRMLGRRQVLGGLAAAGLARSAAGRGRGPPKSDLTGVWTNAWYTKLERPRALKTLVVTAAEAEAFEAPR